MKRRKKSTAIIVIEPEVVEPEVLPVYEPITHIKLQRVPNLYNAIGFALLSIREAKKADIKLTIDINMTNVHCFESKPELKAIDKLTESLKSLL